MGSEDGTVVHRSDVSTLPPMFQPAWKVSPAKGRERLSAIGGDMFSPIKLQQIFQSPARPAQHTAETAFTFRSNHNGARSINAMSSTPIPSREVRRTSQDPPPLTPGGPHVPLRLFSQKYDSRVRSGLQQLVEEQVPPSPDISETAGTSTISNARVTKRVRRHSFQDTPESSARWHSIPPKSSPNQRLPLKYRSTEIQEGTPPSLPRSILKNRNDLPGRTPSRSISFADQHGDYLPSRYRQGTDENATPRANPNHGQDSKPNRSTPNRNITPRTARLEHVLAELEELNVTQATPRPRPSDPNAHNRNNNETKREVSVQSQSERSMLSQASFQITRERLLEVLTDAAPWEPDWAMLERIDLRARRLESCIGLDDYLPNVEEVWLDHNNIVFATGIPSSVRILSASSNCLSELASFAHLRRLEILDVSRNDLTSLAALSDLPALTELCASKNQITSLHGLENLTGLRSLDLQDNMLGGALLVDAMHWPHITTLRLSLNAVTHISGLSHLSSLQSLDVENNALTQLSIAMPQLHTLRVSGNVRLNHIDVMFVPCLNTLYADRCSLATIQGMQDLINLRRVSLRQQQVRLRMPLANTEALERLFLSGNALTDLKILEESAPNLVYLEMAGCQLTSLPLRLSRQTPALRTINLDHNPLTTLPSLVSWTRLKRLSMVGCRLAKLETIVQGIDGHENLCVLDARMNPCTLGFYPPVLLPVVRESNDEDILPPVPNPSIVQPDMEAAVESALTSRHNAALALADHSQFHKRTMLVAPEPHHEVHKLNRHRAAMLFSHADDRFLATLPPSMARQRIIYRGLCGMACATLTWLDGLEVSEAEVARAARDVARNG
ncbi:hypothetical protein MPSI1_000389 [Malassezia psittaci]|uniref:Uncharacterized protein n=1 Tax=Malassezia psittaci TaxID=1821823 RepID=A0AAF0FB74_9BASI|nr:hypothetical protein MPSI1_000389 [Malassezia psittaci]